MAQPRVGVLWQYQDDKGKWCNYESETSLEIEHGRLRGVEPVRSVWPLWRPRSAVADHSWSKNLPGLPKGTFDHRIFLWLSAGCLCGLCGQRIPAKPGDQGPSRRSPGGFSCTCPQARALLLSSWPWLCCPLLWRLTAACSSLAGLVPWGSCHHSAALEGACRIVILSWALSAAPISARACDHHVRSAPRLLRHHPPPSMESPA